LTIRKFLVFVILVILPLYTWPTVVAGADLTDENRAVTPDDYLLAVDNITFQGRPALALVGVKPLEAKSFLLQAPERLVIDLTGFKAHPELKILPPDHPAVSQIRFSQFQAGTLRLVFDLNYKCGYQLIADPHNKNRLILTFNYLIRSITLQGRDGVEQAQIKTDEQPVYTVKNLTNPPRAVVDFHGATLDAAVSGITGDGKCFKRVRVSQYDPHTVRVVFDLAAADCLYQVVPSRQDPRTLIARTAQVVRRLEWEEISPQIGKLVISGSGEMTEVIRKLRKPTKLQIDLDFYRFAPDLKIPAVNNIKAIKGIKLISLGPATARLEIELNYIAGYETQLTTDYHQLTITLINSPVIDKFLALDAGHGGMDHGATGNQGTREKDINLEVTLRLQELLAEAGAKVVLTRHDDYFISLYERSFIANQFHADLFVSVHSNYHPNPDIRGIEVYYYKDLALSARLAQAVERELSKATGLPSLGIKSNDFVVIRETLPPSILVELGFLSNFQEETLINTEEFKANAALGIFQGIIAYYQSATDT
jgi:N-acetylmuramoyl-L-alanine amidase